MLMMMMMMMMMMMITTVPSAVCQLLSIKKVRVALFVHHQITELSFFFK